MHAQISSRHLPHLAAILASFPALHSVAFEKEPDDLAPTALWKSRLDRLSALERDQLRAAAHVTDGALATLAGAPLTSLRVWGAAFVTAQGIEQLRRLCPPPPPVAEPRWSRGAGGYRPPPAPDSNQRRPSHRGLQALHLTGCFKLGDAAFRVIGELRSLRDLRLEGCGAVGDAGVRHLSALSGLTALRLQACGLVTDAGIYSALPRALQRVELWGLGKLGDASIAAIASLPALQHLDVRASPAITDGGLSHLAQATTLVHLSLEGLRGITSAGVAHLAALRQLQHLCLRGAVGITNAGLECLSDISTLRHLDVRGCLSVTEAGQAALTARLAALKVASRLVIQGGEWV